MCLEFIHGRFPIWGESVRGDVSCVSGVNVNPSSNFPVCMDADLRVGKPSSAPGSWVAFLGDFLFSVSATVDRNRSENSSNSKLVNVH